MLFFVILLMSLLRHYMTNIRDILTNLIGKFVSDSGQIEKRKKLESELNDLTQELNSIDMMDEFAKYARTQRKQEKVQENMAKCSNSISNELNGLKSTIYWTLQIFFTFFYAMLMLYFRYEPVFELPIEYASPYLIGKMMAFPNGTVGNIGVLFWAVVCNTTIKSLLSEKLKA